MQKRQKIDEKKSKTHFHFDDPLLLFEYMGLEQWLRLT